MSFISLGLSKFLVTALAIGGTSYSISQIVRSSSVTTSDSSATRTEQTQQIAKQNPDLNQRRDSVPASKKNCIVFLTSVDNVYWVVHCSESNSKAWYLFNQKQGTLDKILGLTSQNSNVPVRLDHSLNKWRSRNWTGIKEYDRRLSQVEKTIAGAFQLKYNPSENIFPFFDYLKSNGACVKTFGTYIIPRQPLEFSCKSFNITSDKFEKSWEQEKYKKAFSSKDDKKCYVQKSSKWEETSCSDRETSSSK